MKFSIDRGRVFNNALWTFAGQSLPLIVILVTLPLFIRLLGVERFGAFTLIFTFFTYLSLLDFGIGMGLTRFLSQSIADGRRKESCEWIDTALALLLVLGCTGSFIGFFSIPLVISFLNIPPFLYEEVRGALMLILLTLPLSLYMGGLRSVMSANQRMDLFNAIEVFLAVVRSVGMLLIAIYSNDLRWVVAFFSFTQVVALILYKICAASFIPREEKSCAMNSSKIHQFFHYGGWLTVSNVVGPIMVYFDRFLLGALLSIAVVPYYTVPYDLIAKILVFPAAICQPFFPVFSALYLRDRIVSKKIFMKTVRFLLVSLFPVILFIFIFAKSGLTLWIGEEFAGKSYVILQWLSIGILINSFALLVFYFILAIGRTDILAKFHLFELCLYLPGLFLLIKKFGLEGAAIAWVLRVSVDAILLFVALIKLTCLDRKFIREVMICLLLVIAFIAASLYCASLWWKFGYWVGIVILFTAWLWKFVMDKEDRLWVMGLIGGKKGLGVL